MSEEFTSSQPKKGDRRQATIVFADISGFTAMSGIRDAEDVRDLMNECFRRIEKIVHERGGVVNKLIGDCAMVQFGAPKALERAPQYACDAALAIRDAIREVGRNSGIELDSHIGINTGVVLTGEVGGEQVRQQDVMSNAVNIASRLESKAANGQILVSAETRRWTQTDFRYSEPLDLEVKGVEGTLRAYLLEGYAQETASFREVGGRRSKKAPLVGRRAELKRLAEFCERATTGNGGVMVVWGESGMGKSRIVSEFLSALTNRPISAHVGYSIPVGRSMSFHPIAGLLQSWIAEALGEPGGEEATRHVRFARRLLGAEDREVEASLAVILGLPLTAKEREAWGMMSPDAQERFVHAAMARLLQAAARSRPLLLVLEDLHWADDSTLTLLEYLLPLARRAPIDFLMVARPGYEETSDRIAGTARQRLGSSWDEISVECLAPEETTEFLCHLLSVEEVPKALVDAINEQTGRNPLFIEELVGDLIERGAIAVNSGVVELAANLDFASIPQTIEGVILSRADRLSPQARATAERCAVLGRQFEKELLAEVEDEPATLQERLGELMEADFIVHAQNDTRSIHRGDTYEFRHALFQESVYQSLLKTRRRELHLACGRAIESLHGGSLAPFFSTLAYHYLQANQLERAEDYLFRAGERAAESAASREALRYFRSAYAAYKTIHGEKGDPERLALLEKQIGLALLNTGALSESVPHFNASLRLRGEYVPETPLQLNLKLVGDLTAIMYDLYVRGDAPRKARELEADRELFTILYNRCRAQNPTDPRRAFFDNLAAIRHLQHLDASTVPHACGIYASAGTYFAFSGLSFSVSGRLLGMSRRLAEGGNEADRFQYCAMRFVNEYLRGNWIDADEMTPRLLERGMRTGLLWDADVYLGLRTEMAIKQGRFDDAEAGIAELERLFEQFGYTFSEANVLANRAYLLTEKDSLPEALAAINRYYDSRDEDTLKLIALSTRAKIESRMGSHDDAVETLRQAAKLVKRAGRIPPYYESAYVSSSLLVAVTGYEKKAAERTAARKERRECERLWKRARLLARSVARDRVEVHELGARLARASGDPKNAARRLAVAEDTARMLGAAPDGERLAALRSEASDGNSG